FLERLIRQADLRHTRYYLLAWPPGNIPPNSLVQAARDCFLTPVRLCAEGLPPCFPAHIAFREGWDHLAPTVPGYPYLAVWTAWELLGQWTPYTLHQVLRLPFPLTLCLHFETPELSRAKALLTSHRNALGSQVNAQNSWVP